MPVFCESCEHMMLPFKDAQPRHALCRKHKNEGGAGFVNRELWVNEAPYLPCFRMNPRGTCPLFEHRRDEQMENGI